MLTILATLAMAQETWCPIYISRIRTVAFDVMALSKEEARALTVTAINDWFNKRRTPNTLSTDIGGIIWPKTVLKESWKASINPIAKSDCWKQPSFADWFAVQNLPATTDINYHMGYYSQQRVPVLNTQNPLNPAFKPQRLYYMLINTYVWYYKTDNPRIALAQAYVDWISGGVYALRKPLKYSEGEDYKKGKLKLILPLKQWRALEAMPCEPTDAPWPSASMNLWYVPLDDKPLYDWRDRTMDSP